MKKGDPQAGEPEGERVALWPEGKVPGMEEHQYDSPFIEWFTPSFGSERQVTYTVR